MLIVFLFLFQKQSNELSAGVGNNAKQFTHFKTQIDKLTQNMTQLEKETAQWREKSEVSKMDCSVQSDLHRAFTQVHLVKICFVSAESQTSPENEPGDDGKGSRPDIPKEEAGRNGQAQSGPH